MNTTRRGALAAIVTSGLLLASHKAYEQLSRGAPHPEYRSIAERLARLPKNRGPLRGIGLAYLRSLRHRPTPEQIAQAWFPLASERQRVLSLAPSTLSREVTLRSIDDYQHGRVANVRGWLLSETEVRLAALVALVRRV